MRAHDDPSCRTAPIRLKRRAEFLRVGKGRRWHGIAVTIQSEARDAVLCGRPRVGFTLTKKVGNAVVRNRARRRLREAVRLASLDRLAKPGHDYVIVGRIEAIRLPFEALVGELAGGLVAVHERGRRREKPRPQAGAASAAVRHADIPGCSTPDRIRPKP